MWCRYRKLRPAIQRLIVLVVLYWCCVTTTLDTPELEFLIRRIDEYIQVMEFMIAQYLFDHRHYSIVIASRGRTGTSR